VRILRVERGRPGGPSIYLVASLTDPTRGGNYLRRLGGEGTPEVADLCFAELAIARGAGELSTTNLAADALDLKHRMPLFWAAVLDLRIEVWLARKIARMARKLSKDRVGVVDAAVFAAVHESPGRLLEIAEAKVIEADPDLHRAKLEEDAQRTGVWLSRVRPGEILDEATGEPATRRLSAKLPAGSAVRCEENIEDLGEAIFDHTEPDEDGNRPSRQECRPLAFEMLTTQPHQAAAFLTALDPDPSIDPAPAPGKAKPKPRPAKIVVHLTDRVLSGQPGVARVEGIGPVLLDKLSDLLDGRDLIMQPVIDLATVKSVNGYEHPTAVKERTLLRTLGDRVRTRDHPRHQRGDLQPRVRALVRWNREVLIGQVPQPRSVSQSDQWDQPTGRHQIRVVERHRRLAKSMRESVEMPFASRSNRCLKNSDSHARKGILTLRRAHHPGPSAEPLTRPPVAGRHLVRAASEARGRRYVR